MKDNNTNKTIIVLDGKDITGLIGELYNTSPPIEDQGKRCMLSLIGEAMRYPHYNRTFGPAITSAIGLCPFFRDGGYCSASSDNVATQMDTLIAYGVATRKEPEPFSTDGRGAGSITPDMAAQIQTTIQDTYRDLRT